MEYEVSVIMPIHNAQGSMERAVQSVLGQEGARIQILLMENGSSDGSGRLCDWYADNYQNVEAWHIEKGNVSNARNRGLSLAKGEFISFVDADDYIADGMYADILSQSQIWEADLVLFDYVRCFGGERKNGDSIRSLPDGGNLEERLSIRLRKYFLGPPDGQEEGVMAAVWRGLFKRAFLINHGIQFDPELRLGEDLIFMLQALAQEGARVRLLGRKYYYYVYHENSASYQFGSSVWGQHEKLFFKLIEELEKEKILPECRERVEWKLCQMSCWIISELAKLPFHYREKKAAIKAVFCSCDAIRKRAKIDGAVQPVGWYGFLYKRRWIALIALAGELARMKRRILEGRSDWKRR